MIIIRIKEIKKRLKTLYDNKIIKNSKGFSILEMLLAVVILLLATQLVAGAMELAGRRYVESTNRSKAQMILSTLSDFVRSELTTASDIVISDDGGLSFIDGSGLIGGRCTLKNEQESICLKSTKNQGKSYFPIVGHDSGTAYKYADNLNVRFELTPVKDENKIVCTYTIVVSDKKSREIASGKYKVTVRSGEID